MDFCWNFCGEQEGGRPGHGTQGWNAWIWNRPLKLRSDLICRSYVWCLCSDLQESVGVASDTGQEWLGAFPAAQPVQHTFAAFQLRGAHLRYRMGTLQAGTWQHLLSTSTYVRLCRPGTSLWLDTLFWDPSRLSLKAFASVHYFLLQCYSYRFSYSNPSDLKAEHWTHRAALDSFHKEG